MSLLLIFFKVFLHKSIARASNLVLKDLLCHQLLWGRQKPSTDRAQSSYPKAESPNENFRFRPSFKNIARSITTSYAFRRNTSSLFTLVVSPMHSPETTQNSKKLAK